MFSDDTEYLNNVGWYIIIVFPLFNIHSIAFKNKVPVGGTIPLKKTNLIVICLFALFSIILVVYHHTKEEIRTTLLYTLTLKENYCYLLQTLEQKYDKGKDIIFNCNKDSTSPFIDTNPKRVE